VFPEPVCANKVRNGPASADQGFSTASKAAAMFTAPRADAEQLPCAQHPVLMLSSCHVHCTPCYQGFSTASKAAAMFTAPHAETHLPLPIPPFLLAQNLSSKWIAPTDNMRPKSDDAI